MAILGVSIAVLLVGSATASHKQEVHARIKAAMTEPDAKFRQWAIENSKTYLENVEEYQRRFSIWKENLEYIHKHNEEHHSHWLGLNVHADLTSDEFERTRLGFDVEAARRRTANYQYLSSLDLPEHVDWRDKDAVTEVKDQGHCGACWAFSTVGAIEGVNAIYSGSLISLSEQELVDCDVGVDHGCNGGIMDHAFDWVIENGGIDTEEDYKYHAKQGICNVARENRHVVTIDSFVDVPTNKSTQLQAAVAEHPVAIAIQANQKVFQLYSGGVITSGCGIKLDHGVLIVGYGTENSTAYWTVKNSWGPGWGEDGYVRIKREEIDGVAGQCGVALMASYPVKNSPNPPRPAPSPPTPPPKPKPEVKCDPYTVCPPGRTCCCFFKLDDGDCLMWSCCPYEKASCCSDHIHCCPHDYPVCDVENGVCRAWHVDGFGVLGEQALNDITKLSVPLGKNTPALKIGDHQGQDVLVQLDEI